jgi:hypothetical protein
VDRKDLAPRDPLAIYQRASGRKHPYLDAIPEDDISPEKSLSQNPHANLRIMR